MHAQSTAGGNMDSKAVVFDSQRAVLERYLAASAAPDRFEVVASPLFGRTPDWWLRRRRIGGRPITTIIVRVPTDESVTGDLHPAAGLDHEVVEVDLDTSLTDLRTLVLGAADRGRLVHLIASAVEPNDDEWAWEAIGLFDLYPDTVAVGGRIHDGGIVLETGRFLGFGDGCGCPDRGRSLADPGYSAQVWKPRSVGAVSALHAVFDAPFLAEALAVAGSHGGSIPHIGAWAGGHARRVGRRVVYSPFLSARAQIDYDPLVETVERSNFLSAFIDLMPDDALLPSGSGLTRETAYQPVLPAPRYQPPLAAPLPGYAAWLSGHIARRAQALTTTVPADTDRDAEAPYFSLLTTLYIGTNADLFAVTTASVLAQTWRNFEWVVLAHGPTTPALDASLATLSLDPRVRLLRLDANLGIVGGMRHVLHEARGEYVVPLDGDDLLTIDALALIARAISEGDAPAFLYTDEDIIVGDRLLHPYLRPDWDPVLDLENSWIWHACAMQRSIALSLDVYGDLAAEYCHDWDSLDRFVAAGHRPVHVSEIVYHWRRHAGSTSNNEGPNEASIASVRHVLQRKLTRMGLAKNCRVVPYPIWRGAHEWWVTHDLADLPPLATLISDRGTAPPHFDTQHRLNFWRVEAWHEAMQAVPDNAIVAIIGPGITTTGGEVATREIVKLFKAFPDVVAVTGPVLRGGVVQCAGLAIDASGALTDFLEGRPAGDPGPYALAWKPFTISAPAGNWYFIRASFLRNSLRTLPAHASAFEIALWSGACAAANGQRVVFTPLATATATDEHGYEFDRRSTQLAWRGFLEATGSTQSKVQGNAAYVPPRSA